MSNARLAALTALLVLALPVAADATSVERRVRFAPGTSGTVLKGRVDPAGVKKRFDQPKDRYILGAAKGQVVTLAVKATKPAYLYVWQDDYNQGFLIDGKGARIERAVTLKRGGDVYIDVDAPGNAAFGYTLTVSID